MKELKELKFEELSLDQKLGMVMAGIIRPIRCEDKYETFDQNLEFVLNLIRNHSLGAVWVPPQCERSAEAIQKVKEAADYPILIFTDAESGLLGSKYLVGRHNSIGMTGSEELAYTFGKVVAIEARNAGYNVVCDPVVDMCNGWGSTGANARSLGNNPEMVSKLAVAIARGLRDGGVLTVAKHYPSAQKKTINIDGHMAPSDYLDTKEDLLNYSLLPYLALMKEDLIDGIMCGHSTLANIDPGMPSTVSKKVHDVIREQGFEGYFVTDALDMMGLKAKFGDTKAKGMCVEAGNEFILPWFSARKAYFDLQDCYKEGIISDARLDEAVKRVLAAQHKVNMIEPKFTEITEKDVKDFKRINRESIFARADEGYEVPISRDGKHFIVMLVQNETDIADTGKVSVDTFTNSWYKPEKIQEKLLASFPNSTVRALRQFPTPNNNMDVLQDSVDYDDVVFITFAEAPAYAGSDHLTHRNVALITALQIPGRLQTLVHFGNPYPLEELPHIPRVIIGCMSTDSTMAAIDVLTGEQEAKGVLTYDIKLK